MLGGHSRWRVDLDSRQWWCCMYQVLVPHPSPASKGMEEEGGGEKVVGVALVSMHDLLCSPSPVDGW